MNTVIPITNERIASHFTKAQQFLVISPDGQKISSHANPALANTCQAKKMIFELFKAEQVKRVIVRNIGVRSLGKLLASNMQVIKSNVNYIDHEILLDDSHSYMTPLTSSDQGRPSLSYDHKKENGGCHHKHAEEHLGEKKCCEKSDENQHKKGKGKCCQQ